MTSLLMACNKAETIDILLQTGTLPMVNFHLLKHSTNGYVNTGIEDVWLKYSVMWKYELEAKTINHLQPFIEVSLFEYVALK